MDAEVKTQEFEVQKVVNLEWHDGHVKALFYTCNAVFLCQLAAWDSDTGRKLYLLVKIGNEGSRRILHANEAIGKGVPDESVWSHFLNEIVSVAKSNWNVLYLAKEPDLAATRITVTRLDDRVRESYDLRDIDSLVDDPVGQALLDRFFE